MIAYRTRSELSLERLEHIGRPLTDEESEQLRRNLHAVYCRNRKARMLAMHESEEATLLRVMEAEARLPTLRERK